MDIEFQDWYLVCAEIESEDEEETSLNHVICRRPSLSSAKRAAKIISNKTGFKLYITPEKLIVSEELDDLLDMQDCACGEDFGACVGDLSCKCGPIDKCKRVDKSPLLEED